MSIITDPLFYLLAIPAAIVLGIGKGGFAGVGMIVTPLIALVLPPLQAAAIVLPILIVQDAISVYVYRRDYSAWNLKVLTVGGVAGIGAAWYLASSLSDAHVRIMVGTIGITFVLYTWFGRVPAEPQRPSIMAGVFWGALSGFTSTLAQAGAPPFQVFVLPQKLAKLTLVGTTVMFFAALNAMKIVPYFALGQFTTEVMATSLILLPLAVAGNFLGIWLVRRMPTALFYKVAFALMFLISVELVRGGTLGLLRGA
ncbi:MAG: sulfite exporter TauE/SafE family protein [Hyphomicrobiales bacterium]|nr:sulfite exporter TauE/SafE family protein [Hyphomicrobiales bacterium]